MSKQPPSPERPAVEPTIMALPTDPSREDRVIATTAQLATAIENTTELAIDEALLEELLLKLDQRDYVEWIDMTPDGDYVWDLTDSPDKVADAVAAAVTNHLVDWLAS